VSAGKHLVELKLPGYETYSREIFVSNSLPPHQRLRRPAITFSWPASHGSYYPRRPSVSGDMSVFLRALSIKLCESFRSMFTSNANIPKTEMTTDVFSK
jgi:hypothetical protein